MKVLAFAGTLWVVGCAPPPLPGGDTADPTPVAPLGGCGALDHRGACQGDIAVWCQDGEQRRVDCALVGERCGWAGDEQGFYCGGNPDIADSAELDGPVDGCAGIDGAGRCRGTSLLWCGGGILRRLDCDAAGAVCAYLENEGAYACVPSDTAPAPPADPSPAPRDAPPTSPPPADPTPEAGDPCGSIDALGTCRGDTAIWCENNQLRVRECGAQGCGWVNNDQGYYCGGVSDGGGGAGGGGGASPVPPPPPPPPPADPPVNGGDCGTADEAEVVRLANASRAQFGLPALECEGTMIQAARGHSEDMCANDYFDHTGRDGSQPWDRMRRAGTQFGSAGENIAWGYNSPQAVHTGWMNSPGHRANLLGNGWSRMGVGVATCNGNPYWTQVFAD